MEVKLRSMQQDSWPRPPGTIDSFPLPSTTAQREYLLVQHGARGKIDIVIKGEEDSSDQLALFQHNATQIVMAALVDGCTIESPADEQGTIALKMSTPQQWHYLHLRNLDVVHFHRHAYNLAVTISRSNRTIELQGTATGMLATAPTEVQVRSSMPTVDMADIDGDETDDDLSSACVRPDEQIFSTARDSAYGSPVKAVPALTHEQSIQGVAETPLKTLKNTDNIPALDAAVTGLKQPVFKENMPPASTILPSIEPTPASLPRTQSAHMPPPSSGRLKRRSTATQQAQTPTKRAQSVTLSPRTPTTILLSASKYQKDKKMASWLISKGLTINKEPLESTDFICVIGDGELSLKFKLLHSLALGRTVVTDKWLDESKKADCLLPLDNFQHPELRRREGTTRSDVFAGYAIHATTAVNKKYPVGTNPDQTSWEGVSQLLRAAGAESIAYGGAVMMQRLAEGQKVLFVANDEKDNDGRRIARDLGVPVYRRDFLWQSILHGDALTEEPEYQLHYDA